MKHFTFKTHYGRHIVTEKNGDTEKVTVFNTIREALEFIFSKIGR